MGWKNSYNARPFLVGGCHWKRGAGWAVLAVWHVIIAIKQRQQGRRVSVADGLGGRCFRRVMRSAVSSAGAAGASGLRRWRLLRWRSCGRGCAWALLLILIVIVLLLIFILVLILIFI